MPKTIVRENDTLDEAISNLLSQSAVNIEVNNTEDIQELISKYNGIENVLTCKSWKYHNKNSEFNYVISSNEIIDSFISDSAYGRSLR